MDNFLTGMIIIYTSFLFCVYYAYGVYWGFRNNTVSKKQLTVFWVIPFSYWIFNIGEGIKKDFKNLNKNIYED